MTYDKLEWHLEAALNSGQADLMAFTHIGLYLSWIIRRGLHDSAAFTEADVRDIRRGTKAGTDIGETVDWKLVPQLLSAEGNAFTAARYSSYLEHYQRRFQDQPPYSISESAEAYAAIELFLDQIHRDWVEAGRLGECQRRSKTDPFSTVAESGERRNTHEAGELRWVVEGRVPIMRNVRRSRD